MCEVTGGGRQVCGPSEVWRGNLVVSSAEAGQTAICMV